jgi:hypothetical protein
MRNAILAKRALAKVGGSGGSGPLGSTTEDPKISGPKTPADKVGPPAQPPGRKVTVPVDPAAAIYAGIRQAALAAAPTGTSEAQAIARFLATSAGAKMHRNHNTAIQAKREGA